MQVCIVCVCISVCACVRVCVHANAHIFMHMCVFYLSLLYFLDKVDVKNSSTADESTKISGTAFSTDNRQPLGSGPSNPKEED